MRVSPPLQAVDALGYTKPSPIQMAAIPLGMQFRDVIGIAETVRNFFKAALLSARCLSCLETAAIAAGCCTLTLRYLNDRLLLLRRRARARRRPLCCRC